ncbi:unnamed protein product [Cuscuta campestris]|uniref:Integrase catalytic domain-containing protein n=1 Tax=Cuscuta campestris TaxID=132261 RepID=A0A484M7S6_9ASTE|nr:unnamed protein product [Cuscuta campestris]
MQIEDLLVQKDLDVVLGDKPEKMSDADWAGLDRKAMSVIRLSLTKNVAFNILKEKTAKGIMDALSNMYEKPSAANKVFLIRELVNTRMREGTSVTEHINKLNSILSRLASVGIKFDYEVQALLLLSSLPDSWSRTATAVTGSVGPDGFTFDQIRDLVLGEDVRRKSSGESSGELLHVGRGRRNSRGSTSDEGVTLTCCEESNVDSWVMDSGASFHATHSGEALQNLVVGDFGKVRLADDSALEVTGMGDMVLKTSVGFWTLKDVRVVPALKKSLISGRCNRRAEEDYSMYRQSWWMAVDDYQASKWENVGDVPVVTADVSSLHTMAGANHPRALNLLGSIAGYSVRVLVDGGSTHYFIHPHVVERLQLPITPVRSFRVYVGNGESLPCDQQCSQVQLLIQGCSIPVDLYVLKIHGPDVVLGVQWLQGLGKITQDYGALTMEFHMGDKRVLLQGMDQAPRAVSLHTLQALYSSGFVSAGYEVYLMHAEAVTSASALDQLPSDLPPSIRQHENNTMPDLQQHHAAAAEGTLTAPYSIHGGLVYYHHRLCVSITSALKPEILAEFHAAPSAGHPGVDRTFRRLAEVFHWPGMRKDVRQFVRACVTCQATKASTQKSGGLLQPLPVPVHVWDDITMDFIVGLPPSRGYTTVMVVVDRLSKYSHFGALPAVFDAPKAATLFVDLIVWLHGLPKSIISDRDPVFMSNFWTSLFTLSGTTLKRSTAYQPQTDGQTEVRNRGLEQYLRAFCHARPAKWSSLLPWAELALNSTYHEGIKMSPFKALYGRDPPPLLPYTTGSSNVQKVDDLLTERRELLRMLKQNLISMQQRMCVTANKHRREVTFSVGDRVLLRLQPHRQFSVSKPLSAKLGRRYYGPFEILERIGPVAYKLRLPEGARVHDTFHVSLLRPFIDEGSPLPVHPLPTAFHEGAPISTPVQAVKTRTILVRGEPQEQWLVEWSDGDLSNASWEPVGTLMQRYPSLVLEDKDVLGAVGSVTEQEIEAEQELDGNKEFVPRRFSLGERVISSFKGFLFGSFP